MYRSSDLQGLAGFLRAGTFLASSCQDLARGSAAARDEVEAWARHAGAANGFGDPGITDEPSFPHVDAPARHETAAALRPARLTAVIASTVGGWLARYRRYRDARATRHALAALDPRALHDLALDRGEIVSVAAECARLTGATRIHAIAARRA